MASDNHKTTYQDNIQRVVTPVLSFNRTQDVEVNNSNILVAFKGNLEKALEAKQVIPLDYGSEFRYPTRISNLLRHHYNRKKNNGHNPKRIPIPPLTNRGDNQEV